MISKTDFKLAMDQARRNVDEKAGLPEDPFLEDVRPPELKDRAPEPEVKPKKPKKEERKFRKSNKNIWRGLSEKERKFKWDQAAKQRCGQIAIPVEKCTVKKPPGMFKVDLVRLGLLIVLGWGVVLLAAAVR